MNGKLWTILGSVLVVMPASLALAQQTPDVDLGLGGLPSTRPSEQMRIMEERNALLQSTGPVDPDTYILGPGDLIGMEVLGTLSISAEDVIGADGSVTFPQIGTLWLGGLTLTEARVRVSRKSENLLRGVEPQLLLKAMRTFKVHVLGVVPNPGSRVATPQTRVSEIIQAAGGFTPRSDTRNIRVTHRDGTTLDADLAAFFINGSLEKNPRLRDGDVVLIQPRTHTMVFSGPLLHPGRYDFVEGDELGAFLELLGLHPGADRTRAVIQRYTGATRWDTLAIDLGSVLSGVTRVPLHPDDRIMLRWIGEWHASATAEVRGAVHSPGVIPIVRGEVTVGKAVRMAGGFLDDAEPQRVILGRPFLPDSTNLHDPSPSRNFVESLTATRLHERVVDLSLNDGPAVEPGDIITVPRFEGWVEVLGQVKRPGFYDFQPGRLTEEYIEAAGGFAKLADKSKTRVSRGRFGDIGYARDVDVPAPGDVIWVPEKVPVTFWALTKDILSVTSQAAALVLVIREIKP